MQHLTCIICPMGCQLEVSPEFDVTGNACPRGESYARKELSAPTRTLTCTVAVKNGARPLVSAKTAGEVPKQSLLSCMEYIRRLSIAAPVHKGDVLVRDLLHTGIHLVACEDVAAIAAT